MERMREPLEKVRKGKDKQAGGDPREADGIPPLFPQEPPSFHSLTRSLQVLSLKKKERLCTEREPETERSSGAAAIVERKEVIGGRSEDQSSGVGEVGARM